jgi:DNA modification methylase
MSSRIMPDRIDIIALEHLIASARNARTHSDQQIAELAASIRAFGFMVPVLVDREGIIIAGHARVLAARQLGLERVPVIVVSHLSESEKRAYALADNKLALNAGWNEELLRVELEALTREGMKLATMGFSQAEFDALIDELDAAVRRVDEDAVPDTVGDDVTRSGDLWVLGEHRLLCADAIVPGSYTRLLGDRAADMVFTDPPYNVAYRAPGLGVTIANDDQGAGFAPFLESACANLLQHARGALYICMSSSELQTLHSAFTKAGGHWSTFIIWGKSTFTLGRADYQRQYEPILYGWREGMPHYWCGARDQGDLWLFDKPHVNDLHPTMKPVALVEHAIRNSSRRGDVVLDPFAGSGTTVIACEKAGRKARVMEVEPHYCDVIVSRWQQFTGQEAKLEDGGTTFEQARLNRAAELKKPEPATDIPCEQSN